MASKEEIEALKTGDVVGLNLPKGYDYLPPQGIPETESEARARSIGGGVADFREAADNAARLTAKADGILDKLQDGSLGIEITVFGFPIFIRLKESPK